MSPGGAASNSLNTPVEQTPLQEKLDDMAAFIGKLGAGAAVATFGALMIIWAIGKAPADVELDAYIDAHHRCHDYRRRHP